LILFLISTLVGTAILDKTGCEKIFTDKESGIKDARPGFKKAFDFLRRGI